MKKHNIYYFLLVVFIAFVKPIMAADEATAADTMPVKMGIELELQDITFVNEANIVLLDHIRLFESEFRGEGGVPDWYLEVDGTGNLEFVTRPFLLNEPSENDCLNRSLEGIHQLSEFILKSSVDPTLLDKPYSFSIPKDTDIGGLGRWVLKWNSKNLLPKEEGRLKRQRDIKIAINDPTFKVRPQATFEFSYELMPNFAHYMATKHPKLLNIVKKVEGKGKLEGITTSDYGFHYLVMLYNELLKEKRPASESGPKGQLALMSRKAFSSYMFDQEESWGNLLSLFDPAEKLFGTYYNIYFESDNLSEKGEVRALLDSITTGMWIRSMRDPSIANEYSRRSGEIWERTAAEALAVNGSNIPAQIIIKQMNEGLFVSHEDLLSPPPFINKAYSMGKNADKNKNAVIEMRGYTAAYSNNIKMGDIIRAWLKREVKNALVNWAPEKLYPMNDYQIISKGISELMETSIWKAKQNALTDSIAMIRAPMKIKKFSPDLITVTPILESNLREYQERTEREFFECNPGIIEEINVQKKEFGLQLLKRS